MTNVRTTVRVLALAATAALAGCASKGGGSVGEAGEMVIGVLERELFGSDEEVAAVAAPAKVPRDMAAKLPYASIGVQIDDNPQFLFLLANQTPTDHLYTLGYQVSVVMRGGRIIRTQGLMQDVLGGRWEGEDIVLTAARNGGTSEGVRWTETNDRGVGTREVRCIARYVQDETITILDTPMVTRRIEEECAVPELKWRFTNYFWVAPGSDQVWMSVQNIHPKVNPLVVETFRPAM